jgi:hypothetical protein
MDQSQFNNQSQSIRKVDHIEIQSSIRNKWPNMFDDSRNIMNELKKWNY